MAHGTGRPLEHVEVPIVADCSHLSRRDLQVLFLLVSAVKYVNGIFLSQRNQDFGKTQCVFDPLQPPNHYPEGVTREEIETYLDSHPDEREAIMSPFTVVVRKGDRLVAIPYAVHYHESLARVSQLLEHAAAQVDNESLKKFLMSRAKAFRTNEFRQSDIDWINVVGGPFELTIGAYESYADKLFGVKRDFEGVLGVVLPEETARARLFQEQVKLFDAFLGARYRYVPLTTLTPMVVIDEVIARGASWYEFVPMAYNLPNDPDIHREVGSKKVFIRNVMQAKMNLITRRVAERVLPGGIAALLESDVFMNFVIGHESSHGLSFKFEGKDFLELGSPLEECKADVFGLLFLYFLADKDLVSEEIAERAVIFHCVDGLRQVRFGLDEAHAVGAIIFYNWLVAHGALRFSGVTFELDGELMRRGITALGDELYALSQTRNHKTVARFVAEWGQAEDGLRAVVASLGGIPVDIDPVFEPPLPAAPTFCGCRK